MTTLAALQPWPAAVGLIAAGLAGALAIRLARRAGWGDAALGAEAARKLQERPVPPIGGPAILMGLFAVRATGLVPWASATPGTAPAFLERAGEGGAWACLLVAFGTGLVDDLRAGGLSPRAKLAGQALAGLALAAPVWGGVGTGAALVASLVAVLATCFATNVWNTFDNADGAATGLAAVGLGAAGAAGAWAVLGFLPWNLLRPRAARSEAPKSPAPFAYLGDSGSHLLGVLLLLTPAAWPVFLLPAADLARLALVRRRAGRAPWQGDRRHLAHRLQLRGWSAVRVLAVLLGIGALPILLPTWLGMGAGMLAFAAAVRCSPTPKG